MKLKLMMMIVILIIMVNVINTITSPRPLFQPYQVMVICGWVVLGIIASLFVIIV